MDLQTYETVVIFTDELREEEYKRRIDEYKTELRKLGMTHVHSEAIGKKKLAYEIRKHEYGLYAIFTYQTTPSKVMELERLLRTDDIVLKFMTVRRDDDDDLDYEEDDEDSDEEDESEQEIHKKPVDVFDLIFEINN